MEFRDVHELVINKLRSVVIRYRLPLSPLRRKSFLTSFFSFVEIGVDENARYMDSNRTALSYLLRMKDTSILAQSPVN